MRLKKWFKEFRLKHHTCKRNSIIIDRYAEIMEGQGWSATHTVVVYKCTICNKQFEID